jgi:hypothetical protein
MSDFPELEAALKELRPAAPSAELITRVEHSLGQSTPTAGVLPRRAKLRLNWYALGFGLTAAAAAVLFLARANVDHTPRTQPKVAVTKPATSPIASQPTRTLVPEGLTRVVYNRSDEGLVYPSDAGAPVRRVRSRSRETLQWKDPGTGASLRVSYPTEEIELIPVSGQ